MATLDAPTVALGRAIGVGDVRWVGRIVRAGEGLGRTSVDWLGAEGGTVLAGRRAEGAAEPGQVSPAPTAPAAQSRAVRATPLPSAAPRRVCGPPPCITFPETSPSKDFFRHC
jgi:hypothetical protein